MLFPNVRLLEELEKLNLDTMPDLQVVLGDFARWATVERETLRPPPDQGKVQRLERLAGR